MLATMVLAACSSDDTTEPVVKRGMVLKANVENTDTRAQSTPWAAHGGLPLLWATR